MAGSTLNHTILNHLGEEIGITKTVLRQLDMRNYLRRHHATGLKQLVPEYRMIFIELEGGDHPSPMMQMLGEDWKGPNTPVLCRCRECQRKASALDNTPLPGYGTVGLEYSARANDLLIHDIKNKRKYR